MLPPLSAIKEMRRKIGWTQKELASRCGVSQSAIAKIERGEMMPSYEVAVRIFEALEFGVRENSKKNAKSIMATGVKWVGPDEKVKRIRQIMKEYAISQVPVIENDRVLGMVTEGDILEAYEKHGANSNELFAREIMHAPPPLLPPDASLSLVLSILRHYPAVLIIEDGKVEGIITRADVVYWA